ncbi:MAG: ATP-binding protein [Gammaproteobacteria bacterium]|nr:ATP-binding protein [Gammaproteobacteria bacterium]
MKYYARVLEAKITEYLQLFPAVGITGPRQAGKSTLLKHLLGAGYQYISFDNHDNVIMFYDDPNRFMSNYADRVVFDEVQNVPEIFSYIKVAIDNDRQNYGKYVLTGSSQFSLMKKITESLAGRIGLLTLLPLQYSEMPQVAQKESVFRGSFPEVVLNQFKSWAPWCSSYISTYLEKDVRGLHNIGDLRDFRRFLGLLAANTAQQLNMSRYANDLGVAVSTIKNWLSVLEASYVVFLLPPYYKNYGKRVVKSPKIYFYDVGLVSYLTGITSNDLFEHGPMAGAIFENYIIAEIMKRELHAVSGSELYYYRTSNQEEIDLIIDRKVNKELIEIKFSQTFRPKMAKELEKFLEPGDVGYLLYNGKQQPFADNIRVLNYQDYLRFCV